MQAWPGVRHRLIGAAPAGGAVVMATGTVSIGLSVDDRELPSRTRFAAAAVVWCAVVGERLSLLRWNHEAAALLVLATLLWAALLPPVLRHWRTPAAGTSFLLVVATESLAVLTARLALVDGLRWLAFPALELCGLGPVFYVIVLARFELRELACARGVQAAGGSGDIALGLWAAAALWLPVLVAGEALRRRRFDERRWSTVFPLGMYAPCSFAVARIAGIRGLADFARVWIWVAFAVRLVVAAVSCGRLVVSDSKKS